LILTVRLYQGAVSPVLAALAGPGGRCRFEPSCSQYAVEAIQQRGAIQGTLLAGWRLCRCQPWGGSGADPVPLKQTPANHFSTQHFCSSTATPAVRAVWPSHKDGVKVFHG